MARFVSLTSGGAALLFSFSVFAQAAEVGDGAVLEEITVTAQKRSESLQRVPLSVAALTDAQLAQLASGGDDIRILSGRVPNLNVESTFGRVYPRFYIRGIGNEDFTLNAQQPVAMYYDEVVLENPVLKGMPAFDLERIEVLRGPQGSLWGKNATAGAVHLISRKPSDDLDGYTRLSLGNFNAVNTEAAIGGALIEETLSGRVSMLYQKRDGWVRNVVTGNKLDGYTDAAWRAQLQWTPSDNLVALARVHGRSLDGTSTLFHGDPSAPANAGNPYRWRLRKDEIALESDHGSDQRVHQHGASLRVSYDWGAVSLVSLTAYESGDMDTVGDVDGSPRPTLINASYMDALHQFTQELRLASRSEGPLGWQAGVYYFDEGMRYANTTANNTFQTPDGLPGFGAYQIARQESKSYAAFGELRWAFTDQLRVAAGARYTRDKVDFWQDSSSFTPKPTDLAAVPDFVNDPFYLAGGRGPGPWFLPRFSSISGDWDEVTWDASVSYAANDQVNLYSRVARGYHGGVITGQAIFDPLQKADPETVTSYEVGVKSESADQRLRINAAAFYYVYDDKQLVAYHILGSGQEIISLFNAKGGTGYGAELDLDYQLFESLRLSLDAGYVKTKVKGPTEIPDPRSSGSAPPLDITGQSFAFAPEWTGSVGAEWTRVTPQGQWFASSEWAYRGAENFQLGAFVQPKFEADGYWEGSGRVGLRRDNFELAGWIRNATNSTGRTSALDVNGYAIVFNGPRTYGIELSMYTR